MQLTSSDNDIQSGLLSQHQLYIQDKQDEKEIEGQAVIPGTTSSICTIFAIVNLMIGSIVLLIPVTFGNSGIITSILIMSLIGFISCISCYWLVTNTKDNEGEISVVLKRILGKKWSNFFIFSSALLLYAMTIVFFQLINKTCWQILEFFFMRSNFTNYADPLTISFTQFSVSWQAIILIVLLAPLFFLKKLKFVITLAGYGALSLYLYILFLFFIFFQNIYQGNINMAGISTINMFAPDMKSIGEVIGNFAIAFMCQNAVIEITSQTKNKRKNGRNIIISYIVAFLIYGAIGLIGCFGLIGRKLYEANPKIIYSFFDPSSIIPFTLEFSFIINLITTFPLIGFIAKNQFFKVIYQDKTPKPLYEYLFSISLVLMCVIIQIYNVNISIVIGIAGNVIGYVIIFLTPSVLIYTTKFGKEKKNSDESGDKKNFIVQELSTEYREKLESEEQLQLKVLPELAKQYNKSLMNDTIFKCFLGFVNFVGIVFAIIAIIVILESF